MRLLLSILLAALASPPVVDVAGATQEISSKWSELTNNVRDLAAGEQEGRRGLAVGPAADNATEAAGEADPAPEPPIGNQTLTSENPTSDPGTSTTGTAPPPQTEEGPPTEGEKDPPTEELVPGGDATPPGPSPDNTDGGPQPGSEANVTSPKEGEGPPPPLAPNGSSGGGPASESGPPPSKSKKGSSGKGASGKGASGTETDPGAQNVDNGSNCASLQATSVKGQVQYTVEVVAATDKDAAVVADDVNDLVVNSLSKALVKNDCKRRHRRGLKGQRRRLQNQRRRRVAENQFLSISSGGSKASGPCPSGDAFCFRVVSTVDFNVVEGSGGADKQVIDALSPAFASLSSNQVRFVGANSGEEDQASAAAVEGSSAAESRTAPGVSSRTIGIVFGVLVASVLAVVLYVRSQRRRAKRFNAELDKVEKELNVTEVTADDSNLVYVYDDESEGYESDYQLTSRERRFLSKLRLPRRKKTKKSIAKVPPQIDATFVDDDDQSVEVIERTTLKVPPVPRTYSGTIITPPPESKRARWEKFDNTVDL